MLCLLYANFIATLFALVGVLVERALPVRFPRRWLWSALIPISLAVPGTYRYQHNIAIGDVTGQSSVGWWAAIDSYCSAIERVWLGVSLILVVWGLINILRVAHTVRGSRRRTTTVDGVRVVVTDSLGPATVGFPQSLVLLPKWVLALPSVQRQYVVRHEQEHRNANDASLLMLLSLPLILAPWNLALWWQVRRLSLAIEVDCDNRVIAALGNPTAYGSLLVKIAEAASRGPRLQPAFLGGVGSLEKRLTMLVGPAPLRQLQQFLIPIAVGVLLFFALSIRHPVLGTSPEHNAMMATR
ncbi:MAG TPA: M56 family metallopeptidase [Gemmatimonadaceae bacterium]|nr:M56 family metallopeptidase [Gemmatimonadaceae bacterium]